MDVLGYCFFFYFLSFLFSFEFPGKLSCFSWISYTDWEEELIIFFHCRRSVMIGVEASTVQIDHICTTLGVRKS